MTKICHGREPRGVRSLSSPPVLKVKVEPVPCMEGKEWPCPVIKGTKVCQGR